MKQAHVHRLRGEAVRRVHRRAVGCMALGAWLAQASCAADPPPAPAPIVPRSDTVLVVIPDTVWPAVEFERRLAIGLYAAEVKNEELARAYAEAREELERNRLGFERLAAQALRPPPQRVDTILIERDSLRIEGHRTMVALTQYEFRLWLAKKSVLPGPSPGTVREVLASGPIREVGDSARVCLRGGGHFTIQASNASPVDPECEVQRFGVAAVRGWTWQVTALARDGATASDTTRLLTFSIRSYAGGPEPDFDTTYAAALAGFWGWRRRRRPEPAPNSPSRGPRP